MKVLFISDGLSLNTGQGVGARRNLNLVKKLSSEVITFSLEGGIESKYEDGVNYIGYSQNLFNKLIDLFALRFYYTKKTEGRIIKNIISFKPDIIFIDSSNLGRLAKIISKHNKNIVSYFIDFNTIKIFEMLKINGFKNIFKYISLFINELYCIRYSKAIYILTEREKYFINKFKKNLKIYILPITIEDKFKKEIHSQTSFENNKKILFVGANYYPNIIGIQLFIEKVFSRLNNYELLIIGKDLDKVKLNTYGNNHIKIYSNVSSEDLIRNYNNANLVICPIFHGGGMKIKIAEGLMFGKVLIASSFALLGYDENINSSDLYICDNIESFYESILLAEKTTTFKNKYSEKNRTNYLKNYTYKNSEQIFIDSFKYLLNES